MCCTQMVYGVASRIDLDNKKACITNPEEVKRGYVYQQTHVEDHKVKVGKGLVSWPSMLVRLFHLRVQPRKPLLTQWPRFTSSGLTCGTILASHARLDHGSRCGQRDAAQHRASKVPP